MKQIFSAAQFVPTQWDSAEQKAKFANHFVRFLESDCNSNLFHPWFYRRLSMTFGHIAHFGKCGFYEVWFANDAKRRDFIRHTLDPQTGGYGDPAYTYSDVEKALKSYLVNWTRRGDNYTLPGVKVSK